MFNCKGIDRSIDHIRLLCKEVDIIALRKTWLIKHDLEFANKIDDSFASFSKSSVDSSKGILRGRPYGGLTILWRKSLFESDVVVSVVECNSNRLAAIKLSFHNRQILFINVYMPVDIEDNLTEFTNTLSNMSAIIDECGVEAVLMVGDYNAHPTARFGSEMLAYCAEQTWNCTDIDILGINSKTFTFLSEAHGTVKWLDHCLATSAAKKIILNVSVDNSVSWSDHFPLYIDCDINLVCNKNFTYTNNESVPVNKFRWGHKTPDEIKKYSLICYRKLSHLPKSSPCKNCDNFSCDKKCTQNFIDMLYNYIINTLQCASMNCKLNASDAPKGRRKGRRQVTGWNYHVRELHAKARLYFKEWINAGKPLNGKIYDDMTTTRRSFKNKLKWCQNNQEMIRMNILATHRANKNFSKFWKATKACNIRSSLPVSVNKINDKKDIANMFANHFSIKPMHVESIPHAQSTISNAEVLSLCASDIIKVVHNMKRGKSPGHDGLSIEHLLYASDKLFDSLALLFNLCIKHTYLPDKMLQTIVVPVVKNKTGDLSNISNYRPISLGTIVGKVLEKLLQPELVKNIRISDAQFGFRAGVSADSAILSVKHVVNYYKRRSTSVYACFLDLSRAFDLVNYNILWRKMHESNVPGTVLGLLRYWYENQTNKVKWDDTTSSGYKLECGVRQGGLTSPDLFNLYVNGLIEELRSTKIGCHINGVAFNNLSYADDMVLLSPSINGLRKLIFICENYARQHGLKYNESKTEMLVFRAGKGPGRVPPVSINGVQVRTVKNFRYLGHMLSENLSDDLDIERERRALAIRCNMLARRFASCSEDVKITLFKAYCISFYTGQLWINYTKKSYNILRVQYNDAFRIFLKHPRYCSASTMFAEAAVPDFYAVLRCKSASFWETVRNSTNELVKVVAQVSPDNIFYKHWQGMHQTL